MTEEEKKLLILDLSFRLSCGVYIQHPDFTEPQILDTIFNYSAYEGGLIQVASDDIGDKGHSLIDCRPYLRCLSSMTREEELDLRKKTGAKFYSGHISFPCIDEWGNEDNNYEYDWIFVFDWLNSHHFDYRGLIDPGLALEAPNGMYKFE